MYIYMGQNLKSLSTPLSTSKPPTPASDRADMLSDNALFSYINKSMSRVSSPDIPSLLQPPNPPPPPPLIRHSSYSDLKLANTYGLVPPSPKSVLPWQVNSTSVLITRRFFLYWHHSK
ncbi:hypothetical protein EB796_001469 [Bugula neritina]|uniref:Uncharacterized protein n=1 Tax=Bugula neritina TaxID=10212 RepID=A0A7J7KQ91_BUGNE|nr:hypothetical protein EB796_001469 [Bugula neritina]